MSSIVSILLLPRLNYCFSRMWATTPLLLWRQITLKFSNKLLTCRAAAAHLLRSLPIVYLQIYKRYVKIKWSWKRLQMGVVAAILFWYEA